MKIISRHGLLLRISIVFFSLTIASNAFALSYSSVYQFDNGTGYQPTGALIKASNGLLYGMTSGGGASGNGVLFKYNTITNTQTKLFDFDGNNGANPYGTH